MKKFNLHLISDSTGETLRYIAKAVMVQFKQTEPKEFVWSLTKTVVELQQVIDQIKIHPGIVMYTLAKKELRDLLKTHCKNLVIPCIPVLSRTISDISNYLNIVASPISGAQHQLDENYFNRVEAINFTLAHDDGQAVWNLSESEIIIIGVSRTSKSPTSIYLAYQGIRTANIPFVLDCKLPNELLAIKNKLVIGLTISLERLLQIRKNRLTAMNDINNSNYINNELVNLEIKTANRIFIKNNWPIIDVTSKSVEEVAANIIQLYNQYKRSND